MALVGLNIRAALGSVPPLLPAINVEFGFSNAQAGLLTSLAAVAIGIFAPLGQRIGARIGPERATAWALGGLSLANLAHLLPAGPLVLFLIIVASGAAMGAASSMVPALISQRAGRARGFVMGVYSTGMALGVALLAGISVPLEDFFGGWRPALAAAGVFAAIAAAGWSAYVVRGTPPQSVTARGIQDTRLPWSSPTARVVTTYLAIQMSLGYACMAWIAPLYLSLGKSPGEAAALLVLFQSVQLASMLGLPTVTDLTVDRRPVLTLAALSTCTGLTFLIVDPLALAVPAVVLAGLGIGGGATLGLVLVVDAAATVTEGTRLTAMSLLVGNLLGAIGPVALGAVKDATGSLKPGLIALLVLGLTGLVVVQRCRPGRRLFDDPASVEDRLPSPPHLSHG